MRALTLPLIALALVGCDNGNGRYQIASGNDLMVWRLDTRSGELCYINLDMAAQTYLDRQWRLRFEAGQEIEKRLRARQREAGQDVDLPREDLYYLDPERCKST
ncbi:MAG: hypothetical protein JJT85_04650 [Chromatiales bacterium]|nr:hypothetical protein [Chromatiales bacterium]